MIVDSWYQVAGMAPSDVMSSLLLQMVFIATSTLTLTPSAPVSQLIILPSCREIASTHQVYVLGIAPPPPPRPH